MSQQEKRNEQARWLWYPGDLERYHALRQNFSRVERGCPWPAFWKSESFRQRVVFRREYALAESTTFTVLASPEALGYVQVGEQKIPFGQVVSCEPGRVKVSVHVADIACVPAIYVQGEVIRSDAGWTVSDYCDDPIPAAGNRYFTQPDQQVNHWPMKETKYAPVAVEQLAGGMLFTFETELTAELEVLPLTGASAPLVYLGESRTEALDTERCYFFCTPDPVTHRCPRQALRYAFLPGAASGDYAVTAWNQQVDIPLRAEFTCDDPELESIFQVAAHTFSLCCDVFFLDGVKRDKWIWGGDAYQSLFVNQLLTGDRGIEQRTWMALTGNEPIRTHVNTIVDYTLLWILGVEAQDRVYGDAAFRQAMWPWMERYMTLALSQRDAEGFLIGREQDWVFVDWADFDREGPLCAEQMLLAAALGTMTRMAPEEEKRMEYRQIRDELLERMDARFWDAERKAYIDSFSSARGHVTRHANIWAIVYDLVDEERKRELAQSVLLNPEIPAITTPYFRFFELEALCRLGYLREVLQEIRAYWGGMLRLGAVTFWEEYNPALPLDEQYAMYGDPYGKSLCHAWAASPIYLLLRYFVGIELDHEAPEGYRFHPQEGYFSSLDCAVPLGDKTLRVRCRDGQWQAEVRDA